MSFAYPAVLVLLVVPVALIAWVWRRTSGRVALPFDHGGQSSGRVLGGRAGAWPRACRPWSWRRSSCCWPGRSN